jgi:phosphate transport system substrate-binding protein
VREFLRYSLSREGQRALIEETGYLPLGGEIIRAQLAKLGEAGLMATGQGSESPPAPIAFTTHTLPPDRLLPSATKILRLAGPRVLHPLAESWAAGFRAAHPEVKLELSFRGTDVGFAALTTGLADIVLAGREIAAQEQKAFEWVFRYKSSCVEVATGGVAPGCSLALAFYVHRDNPLAQLTLAQADAAFGMEHLRGAPSAIRTWGDLGLKGEWAARPIRLYAPHMESGTGRFFREAVLGGSRKLRWEALAEFSDTSTHVNPTHDASRKVLAALARDRFGMAVAAVAPGDLPVQALSLAIGSESVPATADNIASRRYPLARPVYAYFNRAPGEAVDPLLASFLRDVLGEAGQQTVAHEGRHLPLPAALRAEQARLLD